MQQCITRGWGWGGLYSGAKAGGRGAPPAGAARAAPGGPASAAHRLPGRRRGESWGRPARGRRGQPRPRHPRLSARGRAPPLLGSGEPPLRRGGRAPLGGARRARRAPPRGGAAKKRQRPCLRRGAAARRPLLAARRGPQRGRQGEPRALDRREERAGAGRGPAGRWRRRHRRRRPDCGRWRPRPRTPRAWWRARRTPPRPPAGTFLGVRGGTEAIPGRAAGARAPE
jgi:hypothetical protein